MIGNMNDVTDDVIAKGMIEAACYAKDILDIPSDDSVVVDETTSESDETVELSF